VLDGPYDIIIEYLMIILVLWIDFDLRLFALDLFKLLHDDFVSDKPEGSEELLCWRHHMWSICIFQKLFVEHLRIQEDDRVLGPQ